MLDTLPCSCVERTLAWNKNFLQVPMKTPPRFARWLAAWAAVASWASGDLAAASGLLPDKGETLVFERVYTEAHLVKHPNQVVQSMRLRLKLSADGQRVLARLSVRKRGQPGNDYSVGGHALLPVYPATLPVVLNPALASGQASVELREDGAVRVRVLGHADLRLGAGKAPPRADGGDEAGLWRLTATDIENAVFKLLPLAGEGGGKSTP